MACLFAARLSEAGVPVIMLGSWKEGVEALQKRGVTLVNEDGSQKTFPVKAISNPEECRNIINALILVKSWQTERTAKQLGRCLSAHGVALTLQNGMGNREILARELGEVRVAIGITTMGAHLVAPGEVKMAGEGIITLNEQPRLGSIHELLNKAGFMVERSSNLESLLWGKLVINAAINPLTAIFEITNGALLENPYTHRAMKEIVAETVSIAEAKGVLLPFGDALAAVETVAHRTANNCSSMLQDIQRGAPTEIDAICGAIIREAESLGMDAPINRLLWQLVKAKVEL